ncbi:MAG: nitrogenase [Methanospirillum sp.]|nr:nitrogenase [Methanospirillum sp.]
MTTIIDTPRHSCALGGALSTINAIDGLIPIIHGGPGCGGQVFYGQNFTSGYRGSGALGGVSIPSTNTYEKEVVFGGEDRLREQIRTTLELMRGDTYIVLTGCTTELIGDDVKAIVQEYKDPKKRVIFAETPGFKGGTNEGYEIVLHALIDQLARETPRIPNRVNLLGIVPSQDVFWEGDLSEIERVLTSLGLEVNTLFNGIPIDEIGAAALNIVLSPWVGVPVADRLKERFGTPYIINPLPIGTIDTNAFLSRVGSTLNLDPTKVIQREEERVFRYIERVADFIVDFDVQLHFATVSEANYAIALNRFLVGELGWIPSVAAVTDQVPEEYRTSIGTALKLGEGLDPKIIYESDSGTIWDAIEKEKLDFVLGSSLDKDVAERIGAWRLSVSFPVTDRVVLDRGYAGYLGAITLIEDILSAIVARF